MVYDPKKKIDEDIWTRKFIQDYGSKYGITNDMIGWNDTSKQVLLGGQAAINPTRIEDGKSFASPDIMKNAIDDYAVRAGLSEKKDIVNPYDPNNSYSTKIDELLGTILDAKKFEYNPESDPLFQAYQKQYGIAGDRALANTMSEASSLTGNRLNSWATSAGQQAKGRFDDQLMGRIPELANVAYSREQQDRANQMNMLNTLGGLDERDYGRSRDTMADERYSTETQREIDRYNEQLGYGKERDILADERYESEFDYGKTRDSIADYQRNRAFEYDKERDVLADERYDKEWDYGVEQDKIKTAAEETNVDEETLGAMYHDMMNSDDPEQWLISESQYMTNDELKALEKLLPKEASDLITQLIEAAIK